MTSCYDSVRLTLASSPHSASPSPSLTLPYVVDSDGHPQELGLGPDVGVELDLLTTTLCVECRDCGGNARVFSKVFRV